jgi:hypothetical protein
MSNWLSSSKRFRAPFVHNLEPYSPPPWEVDSEWWYNGRPCSDPIPTGSREQRSWLGEMHARRYLDDDEHAAALRYQQDWHSAGFEGVRARDYGRLIVDGGAIGDRAPSDRQERLRQSLHKARAALGPYRDVVEPILLDGEPAHQLAYLASMPTGSRATAQIMRRARAGLRLLAEYYGIICADAPLTAAEAMDRERSWRAHEYRFLDHERALQIMSAGRARAGTEVGDHDGAYVGAATGTAHVDVFAKKLEGGDDPMRRGLTSVSKPGYDPAEDPTVEVDEEVGEIELAGAGDSIVSKRALGDAAATADALDDDLVENIAEDAKTLKLLKAKIRKTGKCYNQNRDLESVCSSESVPGAAGLE